jgi:hypothetical protein
MPSEAQMVHALLMHGYVQHAMSRCWVPSPHSKTQGMWMLTKNAFADLCLWAPQARTMYEEP